MSFGGSTPYLPLRDLVLGALELPQGSAGPDAGDDRAGTDAAALVISTTPCRTCRRCSGTVDGEIRQQSPETLQLRVLDALRRLVLALVGLRGRS